MDTVDGRVHNAPDTAFNEVEHIRARIGAYRPQNVPAEQWSAIEPLVAAAALTYAPKTVSAAYLTMRAATAFTLWATEQGLSLEPERLYSEPVVERFTATGMQHLGDHTRASYRSALRRVGRTITRRAEWTPQPRRLSRTTLSDPYTPEEIE
jgi:hypothetical protein